MMKHPYKVKKVEQAHVPAGTIHFTQAMSIVYIDYFRAHIAVIAMYQTFLVKRGYLHVLET